MATAVWSFVTFSCRLSSSEALARSFTALCTWHAPRVIWMSYFLLYSPPLLISCALDCKVLEEEKTACVLMQGRLLCVTVKPCSEVNMHAEIPLHFASQLQLQSFCIFRYPYTWESTFTDQCSARYVWAGESSLLGLAGTKGWVIIIRSYLILRPIGEILWPIGDNTKL